MLRSFKEYFQEHLTRRAYLLDKQAIQYNKRMDKLEEVLRLEVDKKGEKKETP